MKKMRFFVSLLILMGLIFSTVSCVKDNFDFDKLTNELNYQPSLAAPIAWGNLKLVDAIETYDTVGRLQVNEDGFLSLMYFDYAESDTVSDLMKIGSQSVVASVPGSGVDFTGFSSAGDVLIVNRTVDMHFDLFNPDAELDSLWLDHGFLNLSAVSTYEHAIQLTVKFPTVKKDGVVFTEVLNLLPYGSSDHSDNNDMDGYHVDLTQTALTYNEIPVEMEIRFVHSGGNYTGDLNLNVSLIDPDHKAMFGYFGQNTLIYKSGRIKLDIFDPGDEWDLDDFWFEDPQFKVYYSNSYGIPTNFYFDSVTAHSSYFNEDIDILDYNAGLPMDSLDPYNMTYATNFGVAIKDSLFLNGQNSNIREVIQERPEWINYIAHAYTNPSGSAGHENFVWDDSKFRADIEVELPLWGYVDNFHGMDTSDFDLNAEFDDPGYIERLWLRLNINNGLPILVDAQVYLLDENYQILDSLIENGDTRLIESAEIDTDGKVINKTRKVIELEVTSEKLDRVLDTKYIIYKAFASTSNASQDDLIKIYPDYEVDFDIAAEADIDLDIDLDTLNSDN